MRATPLILGILLILGCGQKRSNDDLPDVPLTKEQWDSKESNGIVLFIGEWDEHGRVRKTGVSIDYTVFDKYSGRDIKIKDTQYIQFIYELEKINRYSMITKWEQNNYLGTTFNIIKDTDDEIILEMEGANGKDIVTLTEFNWEINEIREDLHTIHKGVNRVGLPRLFKLKKLYKAQNSK